MCLQPHSARCTSCGGRDSSGLCKFEFGGIQVTHVNLIGRRPGLMFAAGRAVLRGSVLCQAGST